MDFMQISNKKKQTLFEINYFIALMALNANAFDGKLMIRTTDDFE